ncbi:MAG: glycosyltransferase [Flavobacteriaceae bacterium]|jgi:glycosyltransferase involved in cell wall biosynthesis|nr:glycosyltransferase [Flavobacteriaceae bacterium]
MYFSIIIPVYNRPDEIRELLDSLVKTDYKEDFEVVIIEDGSNLTCENVIDSFNSKLKISYYKKENTGPGDSRNFGMKKAKGEYFLIFDSDCIIPMNYLSEVSKQLKQEYIDCFGGPDRAMSSFSNIQKAIDFSMTSVLTTGGVRGASEKINRFQPRSFNMGLSKKAFIASGGFGNIHPGEDPDLSLRLWKLGFETKLFIEAYVYHKRRIDWDNFYKQVNKFGKARPILNSWYPEYNKITYFLPTIFIVGFYFSIFLLIFAQDFFLKLYFIYFIILFSVSTYKFKNLFVGYLSVKAAWIQFSGYGFGFLESFIKIIVLKQEPKKAFPELFFKK